jgi:hypothetical protein
MIEFYVPSSAQEKGQKTASLIEDRLLTLKHALFLMLTLKL